MIKVKRFHHFSAVVTDLDRAGEFYEGILGLRPMKRPRIGGSGLWFRCGEQELHLIAEETPDPPSSRHMALEVADIKEAHRILGEKGVRITKAPSTRPDGSLYMFIRDPDGNTIEITEH